MARYFRRVEDPHRLLARERAPVSGRRVPKVRSKRGESASVPTASIAGVPVAAVAVAAVVAVLAVGGVVLARSVGSSSGDAVVRTTDVASASTALGADPITSTAATSDVTTTLLPTTIAAVTTVPATPTLPALGPAVRLTSAAAATAATIIPTDPATTSTYSGPLPVFNVALDCTADACSFSMRAFAPGTVTDSGLTSVPATAGRFFITSTAASTCTTSSGNQLSRQVSRVIDLTLSGSQIVNGVSVPQRIAGTATTVTPDAGYVPKVGDVVDDGAEVGCPGQTLIFDVAGELSPG
jgi:hypothetical protein